MLKSYHKFLFLAIFLLAIFLRFKGIYPSYPPYHSDEGMSYAQGISMITEHNLDARGYSLALGYPFLIPYINAFLFKFVFIPVAWSRFVFFNLDKIVDGIIRLPLGVDDYKRIFQLNILGERNLYVLFWGRIIVAIFGVGVVVLVYVLARQIFDKKTAIFAMLLTAINYRQVLNSHINLPDIYNAFFLLLSFIFSYRLFSKNKRLDYIFSGVFIGLSVSTKFQIYGVIGFLSVYLINCWNKKISLKKMIFNLNVVYTFLIAILVFVVINPFHFIHYQETLETVKYESMKYGAGKFSLNFFPYMFLYNIGIGKITSLLVVIGIPLMFIKSKTKFFFLFPTVFYFFYFMTYATNGGFYTRNFVTITPILLVFAGYLLSKFANLKFGVIIIFLIPILFLENFSKSLILANEYSRPWNINTIATWIDKNISYGSNVSAHSSVPLPEKDSRLPFDFESSFSVQEFIQDRSDFAVASLDWVSNAYYDWMNRNNLFYLVPPYKDLESQYYSMAIEELSDYSIYSIIKPALAPESNFFAAKIPKFKISNQVLITKINSIENMSWESKPINVSDYKGLFVKGNILNGYLYANFYKNNEVDDITKKIATRVSGRSKDGKVSEEHLISEIPFNAQWVVIGFSGYKIGNYSARNISIYNSNVKADFGGYKINPMIIDKDVLFPNSQSNL